MDFETLRTAIEIFDETRVWLSYVCVYCLENGIKYGTDEWEELVANLHKTAKENHDDFDIDISTFEIKLRESVI